MERRKGAELIAEFLIKENIPGWRFHSLQSHKARYSVTVSANWRLTFDWWDGDAHRVDFEDYHR